MATPKTLTLTDDKTQKAYELYGKAKVDAAIAKQAGVGQVVKAPSIGESMAPIVKNTWTTTGTTWPVPWSASSVLGGLSAEDPIYAQLNQDALNAYNTPINEEEIKANKLKEYQAQLDALQTVQNDELNKYRIQAQQRSGQASIIQGARGLAGSNVGTAMDNTVTQSNNEIEAAVLAQQALARQAIYGEVRKGAQEEIANKLAAKKAGWEAYLTYIKWESERKSTRNKEVAKRLISSKADPSQLTDADWKDLESKGYSKQDILAEYQDMKAQADAAQSTAQAASDKATLENSKVQAEIDKINADIEKGQLDAMKYYEVGNKIYARNEDGTSRFIGDAVFNPYTGAMQVTAGNSVYDPAKGTFTQAPTGNAPTGGFRTDRHNNPTAMTTDVARSLGLVEGVDYTKGDAFPNNPNLFTARLNGDPIQTTIKALDTAAQDPNKSAFRTQWGQPRWTYIDMTDEQWNAMSPEQKTATITKMYQNEWGTGTLVWGGSNYTASSKWGKQIPTTVATNLSDAKYFPTLLSNLETLISSNKDMFDPIKWLYYAANPYETWAQSVEDDLKRATQLVGKFMEGGVLRAEDEKKYAKMLPKLTDSYDVAQNKLAGVRKMLADKYNGYLTDYANSGYDVSNFTQVSNGSSPTWTGNTWSAPTAGKTSSGASFTIKTK